MKSIFHLQLDRSERADVAQLAEQLICNQQVIGSSPIIGFARELNEHERKRSVSLVVGMSTPLTSAKHEFTSRRARELNIVFIWVVSRVAKGDRL